MNQNNEDRQLSVFEIDAYDDETDVVFLEQAYAYHQQLVAEENRLPLTRIERCETQCRKNKEMQDRDTH
nr:hypothetical protein [Tanacetum cinerariifolium]